jgi:hypothetical protein
LLLPFDHQEIVPVRIEGHWPNANIPGKQLSVHIRNQRCAYAVVNRAPAALLWARSITESAVKLTYSSAIHKPECRMEVFLDLERREPRFNPIVRQRNRCSKRLVGTIQPG